MKFVLQNWQTLDSVYLNQKLCSSDTLEIRFVFLCLGLNGSSSNPNSHFSLNFDTQQTYKKDCARTNINRLTTPSWCRAQMRCSKEMPFLCMCLCRQSCPSANESDFQWADPRSWDEPAGQHAFHKSDMDRYCSKARSCWFDCCPHVLQVESAGDQNLLPEQLLLQMCVDVLFLATSRSSPKRCVGCHQCSDRTQLCRDPMLGVHPKGQQYRLQPLVTWEITWENGWTVSTSYVKNCLKNVDFPCHLDLQNPQIFKKPGGPQLSGLLKHGAKPKVPGAQAPCFRAFGAAIIFAVRNFRLKAGRPLFGSFFLGEPPSPRNASIESPAASHATALAEQRIWAQVVRPELMVWATTCPEWLVTLFRINSMFQENMFSIWLVVLNWLKNIFLIFASHSKKNET